MTQFTNQKLLETTAKTGVVPVFYHHDKNLAVEILKSCYRAGLRAFEFTNRGDEAEEVFEHLIKNKDQYPEMAVGIGTIMDESQAADFVSLDADFIVSPILDEATAKYCNAKNVPWIPGCGTLTEIINSQRLGATLIKVFPGNTLGPGFIKSALGPCPTLRLMPTGGVEPTESNLKAWFDAGVHCVGMGSQLITRDIVKQEDYAQLEQKVKYAIGLVEELRSGI